jgi:adenylate cyclase
MLRDAASWTIGRAASNDFVFEDNSMSRSHAVIQEMPGRKFHLIDLGSSNGTLVNGRRIVMPIELHDGDRVRFGETTVTFHQPRFGEETCEIPKAAGTTKLLYLQRLITVLVVDIRGFTRISQQIDEATLAQTMGTWFRELGGVFQHSGCLIDKYIGDAAMAVWQHEDKIPDASQIRLVLKTVVHAWHITERVSAQFSVPSSLRIGAGINTGVSVTSKFGPHENPDFSPLGEGVNAAFRLESATKESGYDVAVGRLAFECLGDKEHSSQYFSRKELELRGYDRLVEAWLTSFSRLEQYLAQADSNDRSG